LSTAQPSSPNNGSDLLSKLLKDIQFVAKAQASKLLSPYRFSGKNVADVRVVTPLRHDRTLDQGIAFSSFEAECLSRGHQPMTLQNGLQLLQIHGFLVKESLDSGEILQATHFHGISDNVLGSQDSRFDRIFSFRLEFDLRRLLESLRVKFRSYRQKLNRPAFDIDSDFLAVRVSELCQSVL
jgi:hypothetical protein